MKQETTGPDKTRKRSDMTRSDSTKPNKIRQTKQDKVKRLDDTWQSKAKQS